MKVKQLWETFEVGDHVREASGETMHTEFGATCAAGKVTCSKDKALGVSHSQGEVWLCPGSYCTQGGHIREMLVTFPSQRKLHPSPARNSTEVN